MVETFSSKALRMARAKAKLSQSELGEKSGINPGQINRYERGKSVPRLETIGILASALGIEPEELFMDDGGSS